MESRLPLPPQICRAVGLHHWQIGLAMFDGSNPIKVFVKRETQDKKWVSTIEKFESKVMCITRYNSTIKEMFDSSLLVSY